MARRPANTPAFVIGLAIALGVGLWALVINDWTSQSPRGLPLWVLVPSGVASGIVLAWIGWTRRRPLSREQRSMMKVQLGFGVFVLVVAVGMGLAIAFGS